MRSRDHRPQTGPRTFAPPVARLLTALLSIGLAALPSFPAHAEPVGWTCDVAWTGGAGDDQWSSPGNWSTGRSPSETEDVCIGAGAPATVRVTGSQSQGAGRLDAQVAVEVDLDEPAVFALTGTSQVERLRVRTGTLRLEQTLTTRDLEQDGGRLTGPGDLVVTGFAKWSAGAQDGDGTTYVGAPGAAADPQTTRLVTAPSADEASRTVLGRKLVAVHWWPVDGTHLTITDPGALTVSGTTALDGSGQVSGSGRLRFEGALQATGAGEWSLAPDVTDVLGPVALDQETRDPVPGEPATRVTLGAESGSLWLDDAVTVGGGAGLSLAGDITQTVDARVGGAGVLAYLGSQTTAQVRSALSVDVTVAGAHVSLDQALYADQVWVREDGVLDASTSAVSARDVQVEQGTVISHRLVAEERLALTGGATVEGTGVDGEPARVAAPLLEVTGVGRATGTTLDIGRITVDPTDRSGLLVLGGDLPTTAGSLVVRDSQVLAPPGSAATLTAVRLTAAGDTRLDVPTTISETLTGSPGTTLAFGRRTQLWGRGSVDGRLFVEGTTTLSGDVDVAADGRVEVAPQGTLILDSASLGGPGATVVNRGTVTGRGTLVGTVTNDGTVRPVGEPIAVAGSYAQAGTGALWLDEPATGWLDVTGPASLGGSLGIAQDAVLPDEGVTVAHATSVAGRFTEQRGAATCAEVLYSTDRATLRPRACATASDGAGFEGDVAAFGLTVPAPANRSLSIAYRLVPGSARGADWSGASEGVVTIPAGEDEASLRIPLADDDALEGDETFTVELSSTQVRLEPATVTGTIHESRLDADYRYVHMPRLGAGWRPWAMGTTRVAGTYTPTMGDALGWVFDPASGEIAGTTDGFVPQAFNRYDVAVGTCAGGACVRDHGTETLLAHPAGTSAAAADLTDEGTVVGTLHRTGAPTELAVWTTPDAQPQTQPAPPGLTDVSVARTSEHGHLAGTAVRDGVLVAWLLDTRGFHLAPVPATWGRPQVAGVSDDGVVAGQSVSDGGVPHGWRWSPALGLQDLGDRTYVLDADDRGQLAGGIVAADGSRTARIWRGRWITLGTALADVVSQPYDGSLRLETAQLVNDQGTVVVEGRTSDGVRTGVLLRRDAGCEICVTSALEEATWPRAGDFAPAGGTATEGNPARVSTRVLNHDGRERALTLTVTSPDGDELSRQDLVLAPGEETTLSDAVSLDGLAWQEGAERGPVDFTVRLLDPDGATVARRTLRTTVVPRPVVMVHGMYSDASTWAAYDDFLTNAHSGWRGFAVDTMRTGLVGSQPISANANELSIFVAGTQSRTHAFQVDLVAHSMGGLISRYYIHHQMPDDGAAPRSVRRLVMLGTPNAGSFCADLFRIPMTAQLRTDAVAAFNASVTDRRGVPFSVGYGEVLPATCGEPGDSDSVVSSESARHGMSDVQSFARWHTDMTSSSQMFLAYVLPRLQSSGAGAGARLAYADAPPATTTPQPQVLARDELQIAPGASASTQVPVPAATRLLATALGQDLEVTLRRNDVTVSSPPSEQPQLFATASAADPEPGLWEVTVTNHDDTSAVVPLTTWAKGTAAALHVAATQVGPGTVLVTADVQGGSSAREMLTTLGGADGTPVAGPDLHDDGQAGDQVAGDGLWTTVVDGLPSGPSVIDVQASGTDLHRIVSTYVDVVGVEDGPGDDAPVAFGGVVDVPGGETSLVRLAAVDPEGADLAYEIVDGPAHGRLSGAAPFGYRPDDGFAGTDTVRWRASDGHRWSEVATTTIRVGRATTRVQLTQPSDGVLQGGLPQTVAVTVRRADGSAVQQGEVEYRLGDQVRTGRLDRGVGVRFDVPAVEGELPLVATFLGTESLAPSTLTATLQVDTGTAPAPEVVPVVGEAGYPLRVHVHHHDTEGDVVRVEIDWEGDGTFDADLRRDVTTGERWQPQSTEVDTTYAEPVSDGRLVARVTDGGGHVVTVDTPVQIAPHRELGALRRITVDGESVQGTDISADGSRVLLDSIRPKPGYLGQSGVLDLTDGTVVDATVMPDGSPAEAPADTVMSPDGRWVAFTSPSTIDGRWVRQAYVRDLRTDRTTLVSTTTDGGLAPDQATTLDVTDDGRVLFSSAALGLVGSGAVDCGWTRCVRLYERDTSTGFTRLLTAPGSPPVDMAVYSANGRYTAWSQSATTMHLYDASTGTITSPALPDGTDRVHVDAVSDDGLRITFEARTTVDGVPVHDVVQLDRASGRLTVLSTTADGRLVPAGAVGAYATDASGQRTVWASPRDELVEADTNQEQDLFLHEDGRTRRISVESRDGTQADGPSGIVQGRSVSADGRWVLFTSEAGNLVPGDVGGGDVDTFLLDLGPLAPPPPDNRAPELTVTGPATAPEGATVSVTGAATDADGDELTWTWQVDGGALDVADDGASALLAVGDGPAERTVTVAVDDGTTTVSRTITVQVDNRAPTLLLDTSPVVREVRQVLALKAVPSDVAGDRVSCTFDWDDGVVEESADCAAQHAWAEPGARAVRVVARDEDGGSTSLVVPVTVVPVAWPWDGFFQPVDNLPLVNTVKAGQAVPVKFSLGGYRGLDVFAPGFPQSGRTSCSGAESYDAIESTVSPGAATLTYDPGTTRYQYVWKTSAAWAGQCRTLVVRLADGSEHVAKFRFR